MATVLVTGGTGFIGSWCVVKLLEQGHAVRTTVRKKEKEAGVRRMVAKAGVSDAALSFAIADLTSDAGWAEAVAGVDYVLHVASPLGLAGDTAEQLISQAREGSLRVLRAAVKAGVKRVVLTSSAAAATPTVLTTTSTSDETTWTDEATVMDQPYRRSKVLAERAAWDFMRAEGGKTELVTILPTAVLGPVLSTEGLGSVALVERLLTGKVPAVPRLGLNVVDVRDVADLHVRAMEAKEAAGQRYFAAGDFMWMADVAKTLRDRLGARASRVPKRNLPDAAFWLLGVFKPEMKAMRPLIGRAHRFLYDNAAKDLGYAPRRADAVVVDTAEALLESGAA